MPIIIQKHFATYLNLKVNSGLTYKDPFLDKLYDRNAKSHGHVGSCKIVVHLNHKYRRRIHEHTISLRFLGIQNHTYSKPFEAFIRVQNMNLRPSPKPKHGKMPIRVTDLAFALCVLYYNRPCTL